MGNGQGLGAMQILESNHFLNTANSENSLDDLVTRLEFSINDSPATRC